jgi:Kef-type K+ transport system membrane component KefB
VETLKKAEENMLHLLHLQKPPAPGFLLSIIGALLTLIGLFLPLMLVQNMGAKAFGISQWELIISFTTTLFYHDMPWSVPLALLLMVVLLALTLPVLTSLMKLALCWRMLREPQYNSVPARGFRYAIGAGAILEIVVCLVACFLPQLDSDIFPHVGFFVLVLASILLLVGEVKQGRGTYRENDNADSLHS